MKTCSGCKEEKETTEFHKNSYSPDGFKAQCKVCLKKSNKEYYQTKPGLITKLYGGTRSRSKKREQPMPTFTKEELTKWLENETEFSDLYSAWVGSSFSTDLIPSIDRLSSYGDYTFDNMQLITWKENLENNVNDHVEGNGKNNKPVTQYTKEGTLVEEHLSVQLAATKTGINKTGIILCCQEHKNYSHAGGFKWNYKN